MTDDLVWYVSRADIDVVLARVPLEKKRRLRETFLKRRKNAHCLGWVRSRGRRDLNLVGQLPPRVSLRGYVRKGNRAEDFGAPSRGQWPPLAVRRFLLYHVLLHELGHIQVVRPAASGQRRRFASEPLAEDFAIELRADLWSTPFDHADPVHHAPGEIEMSLIPIWERMGKAERLRFVRVMLGLRSSRELRGLNLSDRQRGFVRDALPRREGR